MELVLFLGEIQPLSRSRGFKTLAPREGGRALALAWITKHYLHFTSSLLNP